MTKYHSDDYIGFLRNTTPRSLTPEQCNQFCVGEDCPLFAGVYDFCQLSAGGSICGARKLNSGDCDVAVNWAGGLHHARRSEASGFCYVNDIVLGILELLTVHERVLYIDIDIHHGDGVEEAFYTTPRVMTLSFHKYGFYFPGSGAIDDIGAGAGRYHAVNFPLQDGITDAAYETIFKPVVQAIMDRYRPGAVVLQCGADSLSGDRLGTFNMTLRGHGACVEFVRSFGLPTLMVGGGGYTVRNVARCWCNETAIMLGETLPDDLPYTEYLEYFSPDFHLQVQPTPGLVDMNTPEYLNTARARILDNLRYAEGTPQISMPRQRPPRGVAGADEEGVGVGGEEEEEEEYDVEMEENPELRMSQMQRDRHVERDDEFMDGDDDELRSNGALDAERRTPAKKKPRTVVIADLYPFKVKIPCPSASKALDTTAETAATTEATTMAPATTQPSVLAPLVEPVVPKEVGGGGSSEANDAKKGDNEPVVLPHLPDLELKQQQQQQQQSVTTAVTTATEDADKGGDDSAVEVETAAGTVDAMIMGTTSMMPPTPPPQQQQPVSVPALTTLESIPTKVTVTVAPLPTTTITTTTVTPTSTTETVAIEAPTTVATTTTSTDATATAVAKTETLVPMEVDEPAKEVAAVPEKKEDKTETTVETASKPEKDVKKKEEEITQGKVKESEPQQEPQQPPQSSSTTNIDTELEPGEILTPPEQ